MMLNIAVIYTITLWKQRGFVITDAFTVSALKNVFFNKICHKAINQIIFKVEVVTIMYIVIIIYFTNHIVFLLLVVLNSGFSLTCCCEY